MTVPDFVLCALFVAYFAHVIPHTDGLGGIFRRTRERFPNSKLLQCPFCLAPYLAAIAYGLLFTPASFLVAIFAIAGAGLCLSAFTGLKHL